jgi:hypothetical protein
VRTVSEGVRWGSSERTTTTHGGAERPFIEDVGDNDPIGKSELVHFHFRSWHGAASQHRWDQVRRAWSESSAREGHERNQLFIQRTKEVPNRDVPDSLVPRLRLGNEHVPRDKLERLVVVHRRGDVRRDLDGRIRSGVAPWSVKVRVGGAEAREEVLAFELREGGHEHRELVVNK